MAIYMNIAPGEGADNPLGYVLFKNKILLLIWKFAANIFHLITGDQIRPSRNIGQGKSRITIYTNIVELSPLCCMPNFKIIGLPVLEDKIFKGFCHIWHWGHHGQVTKTIFTKFMFHLPKKAPHKLWL